MAENKKTWADPVKFSDSVIDRIKGRKRNWILRLGVELEGAWNALPKGVTGLQRDGSLDPLHQKNPTLRVGELPSPPYDQPSIEQWMRLSYPHIVDEHCGMHVHMSFKTALTYQRLLCPEYDATVVEGFKKWAKAEGFPKDHHIWPRLNGESRYCQHVFYGDMQVTVQGKDYDQRRPGHRYTVINRCYQRGTMECRLLPMFETSDQAIRALRELIFLTNAFLLATAKRETKYSGSVEVDTAPQAVVQNIFT